MSTRPSFAMYTTFVQVPVQSKPAAYFIIIDILFVQEGGERVPDEYQLLNLNGLYDTVNMKIADFDKLIESKAIQTWKPV